MQIPPVHDTSLDADRRLVEDRLSALLPGSESAVSHAMRYAVLGGGQRLRPILSLRACRALGGDEPLALRAASAVELMHCASLIVDDLPCMDDDSLRRDRAAVHIEFGEANAVLAAFGLVSLSARAVGDRPCFQMKLLATLDCNGLIGGQALDLELSGAGRDRRRADLTALKTVPLFRLAVEAGIDAARSSAAQRDALLAFGCRYGEAYQLMDDYLDGELGDLTPLLSCFDRARASLSPLGRAAAPLRGMLDYLNAKIPEENCSHR